MSHFTVVCCTCTRLEFVQRHRHFHAFLIISLPYSLCLTFSLFTLSLSRTHTQMLNAVVNRPAPVARQKSEVFADSWEEVLLRFVPLQADEAGYGGEVSE